MAPQRNRFRFARHSSGSARAALPTSPHDEGIDPPHGPIAGSGQFDEPRFDVDSHGKHDGSPNRTSTRSATRHNVLGAIPPWQWALASSGWITLLCVNYLAAGSLPRVIVVFAFVLVCPGLAVVGLIPTKELPERWVLAVALSMSFGLLVSVVFTVMRVESVMPQIVSLALITSLAVLINAVVSGRRPTTVAPADEKADR
jgi:hypothetical protein